MAITDSATPRGLTLAAGVVIALLMLLSLFHTVVIKDFWFADEPREGGMVVQMADSHLYSIPYLGNEPFVEKPPLYPASAALSYQLFGDDVRPTVPMRVASLFWGALTAIACYLLTATLVQRDPAQGLSPAAAAAAPWAATAILSTASGFASNALTIRVDIALACTYLATVLCASRWIFTQRLRYLYLGALCLSLSFLAKGLIGPVLTGASLLALSPEIAGLGLNHWRAHARHYLLALAIFLLPAGTWVFMLYHHGGSSLLNFWLVDNQLTRFTGGGDLWHEEPGNYGYYLRTFPQYIGLWLPLTLAWLGHYLWRMVRGSRPASAERQALLMFLLPLTLLSIATTKRPVYVLPLLPVCAVGTAIFLCRSDSAWLLRLARWLSVAFIMLTVTLALLALLPASDHILRGALKPLTPPQSLAFATAGAALGVLVLQLRSTWQPLAVASAFLLLLLAYTHYPAQNERRGQHAALQSFLAQLTPGILDRTAGSSLDEGFRGYLYIYTRHSLTLLSASEAIAVLSGADPRFECVMYARQPSEELPPHRVAALLPRQPSGRTMQVLCRP